MKSFLVLAALVFLLSFPNAAFGQSGVIYCFLSTNNSCFSEARLNDPLDARTPLIIINGWNHKEVPGIPNFDLWYSFLYTYTQDRVLQARFKLYIFAYKSNAVSVSNLGEALGNGIDKLSLQDSTFASRQVVIVAYSLGGLVARSFMEEYRQSQGLYAGRLGGDRVLKLITLGTPHHGSPLANGPARDLKTANLWGLTQFLFDNLFYFFFGPSWSMPNRSDLRWDNFDGLLDYLRFSAERNTWLESLNSVQIYDGKIIAYAGNYAPAGDCSGFSALTSYCYGSAILGGAMDLASDGVVPLSSARFENRLGISRVASRSFSDYNHDDIVAGKTDGLLMNYLRSDLLTAGGSPFGSFDTPAGGSSGFGEVALTGWALDDLAVTGVDIYRDDSVFVGSASFVTGTRPDIAAAYPLLPNNTRAGWGYMLMSNFLPNKGNGTFVFSVYARDADGHSTLLGLKSLTFNNSGSLKPFGTLDTPAQGETVSGMYTNFGWVLTPQPNLIPTDGSTIDVYIDNVYRGHPMYNQYRADIAALFPGLKNTNGAVGYFRIDTKTLANGLHTIFWTVRDSAGNSQGIGSRYFTVRN